LGHFSEANVKEPVVSSGPPPTIPRWLKPSLGWVKLNWDGALNSSTNNIGAGVVVRNEAGELLVGLAVTIPYVSDSLIVEVMATWRAVELGRKLSFQRIILEGDSLIIVGALNQSNPCLSGYEQMMEDIRVRLLSFPAFVVRHVCRQANTAAHSLAKHALALNSEMVWLEECPSFIFHIVIAE
jgi:ribonuclease HI